MSMYSLQLKPEFIEILQPLGANASDFFFAASLYHAHKVSFAAAAALADLSFEEFNYQLRGHFGQGLIVQDETIMEDIATVQECVNSGL
jgi:hypothetical protein